MIWQHVLSLSVFSSYLLSILGLFSLIAYTLFASKGVSYALSKSWIFGGLTVVSLVHTWFCESVKYKRENEN